MNQITQIPFGGMCIYDVIGIGFGPSNMSLAISLEEKGLLSNSLFLEKQDDFLWHPGMLIEGSDIQHNPLRDVVTPRNPASPYGFLSYLKEKKRLYNYLNLAAPFPPRTEYASYIKWVGDHFRKHVKLSTPVTQLSYVDVDEKTPAIQVGTADGQCFLARSISVGPGRSNFVPNQFKQFIGDRVVHLTDYLFAKARWTKENASPKIAVVGGSQSAIEILLDLDNSFPDGQFFSISRGFGFKQKDLSAFTEQIYYPEFVDYFFEAGVEGQNKITAELWRSNYGAADPDVIEALNMRIYEQGVVGHRRITMLSNSEILDVKSSGEKLMLKLRDRHARDSERALELDGVILATGFKNFGSGPAQEVYHPLLAHLVDDVPLRADGGVDITRDYRLNLANDPRRAPVYLNGLCEASHGFGDAGSFSILSMRSETISDSIENFLEHRRTPSEDRVNTGEV